MKTSVDEGPVVVVRDAVFLLWARHERPEKLLGRDLFVIYAHVGRHPQQLFRRYNFSRGGVVARGTSTAEVPFGLNRNAEMIRREYKRFFFLTTTTNENTDILISITWTIIKRFTPRANAINENLLKTKNENYTVRTNNNNTFSPSLAYF